MRTARRLFLIYTVAVVNILTTLLPIWPGRYRVLAHGVPVALILASQHVTLFAGISMLLLAYPAAHRHRRSTQLLMACTGLAMSANLLKGLDIEEAIINGLLLWLLWRERHQQHDRPLRYTIVDVARLALLLTAVTVAYNIAGKATLAALHRMVEHSENAVPRMALGAHVLTAKLPLQLRWYHETELLLPVFVIVVILIFSWTSLLRSQGQQAGEDDPYRRFGRASHNSLAYLARRHDVLTFLDPDGRGAITYRCVGRVALQIGAILAREDERLAVYRAFCDFCRTQRLIPSAVALSQDERPLARLCGMHTIPIGTEAVVNLRDFALEKLGKKMRWAQRSLSKRGFRCELLPANEVTGPLRVALDGIDDEWRQIRGGQLHGCCMTLGRFPTRADGDCLIATATDEAGVPVAYLTLLPGGEGFYSLDLTRRRRQAPNAITEFLLIEVLTQLKERAATQVSLNFSTFSSLASTRGGHAALKLVGKAVQLGSLEAFNAKFCPNWVPRYVAVPSWWYLPDVTYAILHVEGVDRMVINAVARWFRHHTAQLGSAGGVPRLSSELG